MSEEKGHSEAWMCERSCYFLCNIVETEQKTAESPSSSRSSLWILGLKKAWLEWSCPAGLQHWSKLHPHKWLSAHITSHEKEQSWVYFIMSGCKNEVQGLMVVSLLMLLFDAFKVQMNQQDSVNSVQTGMCIGDFWTSKRNTIRETWRQDDAFR